MNLRYQPLPVEFSEPFDWATYGRALSAEEVALLQRDLRARGLYNRVRKPEMRRKDFDRE